MPRNLAQNVFSAELYRHEPYTEDQWTDCDDKWVYISNYIASDVLVHSDNLDIIYEHGISHHEAANAT